MMEEVRVCPICHFHNPLDSLFCRDENCGEDISFVPPTSIEQLSEKNEVEEKVRKEKDIQLEAPKTVRMTDIKLRNTLSGYELVIPFNGGVIGRSGTIQPEHFQSNHFVSNIHAKISLGDNGYVLIDENSTNGTKINGDKLVPGVEHRLNAGDRVIFANMEFIVE